jgi:hypothetical protein
LNKNLKELKRNSTNTETDLNEKISYHENKNKDYETSIKQLN